MLQEEVLQEKELKQKERNRNSSVLWESLRLIV